MEFKKKEELPLVSVIVPSYNHERFITECIESIVNQTYKNIELIIIDDGSIDNSPEVLKELQAKYGFKLTFQENHGIAYTLNKGIKGYSGGEYISICASDDYWTLDKIEKQVNFMETNRFYPMCYGKSWYVDDYSNILKKKDANNRVLRGGFLFEEIFLFKLHPPVNYMFRKDIFKEVGLYDEQIFAEDYYMNLKISSKYNIGFLDEYLGYYRFPTATPGKIMRFNLVADSHIMAIEEYKGYKLYNKAKSMVYLRKFDTFSGFKAHKIMAARNLFMALPEFLNKRFIVALIKLFIFWK